METFLSLLGVAVLLAAFLIPLARRNRSEKPTEQPAEMAPRVNGDSRLPSAAFWG